MSGQLYNVPDLGSIRRDRWQQREAAKYAVMPPAIALICVAGVSILACLAALGIDVLLIASGAVQRLEDPEFKQMQIGVRSVWGIVLIVNSGFIIWAMVQMMYLRQHQMCFIATILAMVPAISPCLCLGIPFGIWAMVVLKRDDVTDAFES